jgi:hypothetical protein
MGHSRLLLGTRFAPCGSTRIARIDTDSSVRAQRSGQKNRRSGFCDPVGPAAGQNSTAGFSSKISATQMCRRRTWIEPTACLVHSSGSLLPALAAPVESPERFSNRVKVVGSRSASCRPGPKAIETTQLVPKRRYRAFRRVPPVRGQGSGQDLVFSGQDRGRGRHPVGRVHRTRSNDITPSLIVEATAGLK